MNAKNGCDDNAPIQILFCGDLRSPEACCRSPFVDLEWDCELFGLWSSEYSLNGIFCCLNLNENIGVIQKVRMFNTRALGSLVRIPVPCTFKLKVSMYWGYKTFCMTEIRSIPNILKADHALWLVGIHWPSDRPWSASNDVEQSVRRLLLTLTHPIGAHSGPSALWLKFS